MDSIGKILKKYREDKGYSLKYVMDLTNISQENILALENENFDNFPSESYVRGFLRNYAHVLGQDPDTILKYYDQFLLKDIEIPSVELWGVEERKKSQSKKKYIIIAISLILVLLSFVVIKKDVFVDYFAEREYQKAQNSLSLDYAVESNAPPLELQNNSAGTINFVLKEDIIAKAVFKFADNQLSVELNNADDFSIGIFIVNAENPSYEEKLGLLSKDYIINLNYANEQATLVLAPEILFEGMEIINETTLLSSSVPTVYNLKITSLARNQWLSYQIDGEKNISKIPKINTTTSIDSNKLITLSIANTNQIKLAVNEREIQLDSDNLVGLYKIGWYQTGSSYSLLLFELH